MLAARGAAQRQPSSSHEEGMQDASGMTALVMAASRGHADEVGLLLDYEKGMQKESGETALMVAVEKGHTEVVKTLLSHERGRQKSAGWTTRSGCRTGEARRL